MKWCEPRVTSDSPLIYVQKSLSIKKTKYRLPIADFGNVRKTVDVVDVTLPEKSRLYHAWPINFHLPPYARHSDGVTRTTAAGGSAARIGDSSSHAASATALDLLCNPSDFDRTFFDRRTAK